MKKKKQEKYSNIFDLIPIEVLKIIFNYMQSDSHKVWYNKFYNWSLTCKNNWNTLLKYNMELIPPRFHNLPTLVLTKMYGSVPITTTLTKNGSHFLAKLQFAIKGGVICGMCGGRSYYNHSDYINYNYGGDRISATMCNDCSSKMYIDTDTVCKILKINNIFKDKIINKKHMALLYNDDVYNCCRKYWTLSYNDAISTITFNKNGS
jgi:hypothetical protein